MGSCTESNHEPSEHLIGLVLHTRFIVEFPAFIDFVQFQGGRSHDRLYNSWGSPYLDDNANAKLRKAEGDDIDSQQPSTAFVEDGSYLRMENLRLGYDLNRIIGNKFRNIQVYGQVTNLFTITKYSGLESFRKSLITSPDLVL